jgi:hypothetical protein
MLTEITQTGRQIFHVSLICGSVPICIYSNEKGVLFGGGRTRRRGRVGDDNQSTLYSCMKIEE